MKIELAHDSIARKVYERASATDRVRLRVLNLIRLKHQLFETEHNYLTRDEVRAIRPFESQLQLNPAERNFLIRSKIMARKQEIGFLILTLCSIIILAFFLLYYRHSSIIVAEKNLQLQEQDDQLRMQNANLIDQYEELRIKDSIQNTLLDRIDDGQQIIRMTNQELQEALTKLRRANKALEESNEALAESKKALERERDKLKEDKRDLTRELTRQVNIVRQVEEVKAELTAVEQSQKLSQRAQAILQNRETPTDRQYKEAFQLARYAWELSPKNSQAMDVLNTISNQKQERSGSGGFLEGDRPRITYTRSKIEDIIDDLDRRYQYGKLPESEAKRLLRR